MRDIARCTLELQMSSPDLVRPSYSAVALFGRLLMGAIFVLSGADKLLAPAATMAGFAQLGLPVPSMVFAVAVLVELGIGLAFCAGLFSRSAALILAFWCIATAMVAHTNFADRNMMIHFFKNVSMCGGYLSAALLGPGAFSIDALVRPSSFARLS
jgi:putative oxidoreductase